MKLNHDICYKAIQTKDSRFDGRFYTAVKSTGIFCRPICPVKAPKTENCIFYPSAAAALDAGFRPCLRCRPETAPNSPAWNGTRTTVIRAEKLIRDGALNTGSVSDLCDRLGVGERHLRRLFLDQRGATPKAVGQAQRLLFAKQLITESTLPLTEVAYASGFQSIRRFNDAFKKLYNRTPREMRKNDPACNPTNNTQFETRISYRPPFDWQQMLSFFRARAISGMEEVGETHYRRTIQIGNNTGQMSVTHDNHRHCLSVGLSLSDISILPQALQRIRQMFDLETDLIEIQEILRTDPFLAARIDKNPAVRIPGNWDLFEISVRAVLGQQISVAGAATIAGRIVQKYGKSLTPANGNAPSLLFPTATCLAKANLEGLGLTKTRARTLKNLALEFAENQMVLDDCQDLSEIEKRLCSIKGIGPWTAQYIALRGLKEPDAFPSSDLGLLRASATDKRKLSPDELSERAENWRPFRAYAAQLLWSSDPGMKNGTGEKKVS